MTFPDAYPTLRALALLWMLAAGCSFYFDSTSDQCTSDRDCEPLRARCDRAHRLCAYVPQKPEVTVTVTPPAPTLAAPAPDAMAYPVPVASPDARAADRPDPPLAGSDQGAAGAACAAAAKPVVPLQGDIEGRRRLTCENDYLLLGPVSVRAGAVLAIDAGTTVLGDAQSRGVLIVQPGGRLEAAGLQAQPVVFSSAAAQPRPGDWGGLVIFGRAPASGRSVIDGLGAPGAFGGDDEDDDSGILRFVRIEFSGRLRSSRPIAALTLAGVGRGTEIDNVQIRRTAARCIQYIDGTVNPKQIACD